MTNWVKTSERLPEPEKKILLYIIHLGFFIGELTKIEDSYFWNAAGGGLFEEENVEYWAELPEAPKNE